MILLEEESIIIIQVICQINTYIQQKKYYKNHLCYYIGVSNVTSKNNRDDFFLVLGKISN